MYIRLIILGLCLTTGCLATLNDPCVVDGIPGVCLRTKTCTDGGGLFDISGCESDPIDIQCCTKPNCAPLANCKWRVDCVGGSPVNDLCPGPSAFKCCIEGIEGIPSIPARNCQSHVINFGYIIMEALPGAVKAVHCYDPNAGNTEHHSGLALDLMVNFPRPTVDPNGRRIADYVMNNAASLEVEYVIWGAKIWHADRDGVAKPWESWRPNPFRPKPDDPTPPDDPTKNHWDHNHVQFKPRAATRKQDEL